MRIDELTPAPGTLRQERKNYMSEGLAYLYFVLCPVLKQTGIIFPACENSGFVRDATFRRAAIAAALLCRVKRGKCDM